MGCFLTPDELSKTTRASRLRNGSPIPTHAVTNGEFTPPPRSELQRRFEGRLRQLAEPLARKQGMARRKFLKTAAGMATAFVAMNEVFGPHFVVESAEAADPERAAARARRLAKQFVFDEQLHFIRDYNRDARFKRFLGFRTYTSRFLDPKLGEATSNELLKFPNFVKEVFLDSDTKVGMLTGSPNDDIQDWHLNNDEIVAACKTVNKEAGSTRMLGHAIMAPNQPGWMEEIDRVHKLHKPAAWKGYTMGDPSGPSNYMWRLDDEKLMYPAYERMVKAGVRIVCVHKGLLPDNAEEVMPGATAHSDVSDLGKAAKDWPQISWVVYHSGFRPAPRPSAAYEKMFEESGRIDWVSDLAKIPDTFGVKNVYGEIGSSFAFTCVTNPRLCAGMLGTLIKGLGADHVLWGTDSIWYGSPQWQIEALRRMEIPIDLQKKFGFAPLGDADGEVKRAILGRNAARLHGVRTARVDGAPSYEGDRFAMLKEEYERLGPDRSNIAYGYIARES